jgi:hypothetical protein
VGSAHFLQLLPFQPHFAKPLDKPCSWGWYVSIQQYDVYIVTHGSRDDNATQGIPCRTGTDILTMLHGTASPCVHLLKAMGTMMFASNKGGWGEPFMKNLNFMP